MCNFTTVKKKTEKKTRHISSIAIIGTADQVFEVEESFIKNNGMHRIKGFGGYNFRHRKNVLYVTRSATGQIIIISKKKTIRERSSRQTNYIYAISSITRKPCDDTFTSMKATIQMK